MFDLQGKFPQFLEFSVTLGHVGHMFLQVCPKPQLKQVQLTLLPTDLTRKVIFSGSWLSKFSSA